MTTTRRDLLTAALTAAGASATTDLAHAQDHSHQAVPSDVALRVKSLESLLVEKGLVDPAALEKAVAEVIAETGATSPKDMGRVMKAAMTRLAGQMVDGKAVNELVRRKLGS